MPPLLGQFQGEVLDSPVEVRVYSSHLELAMSYAGDSLAVVVDIDEVGKVEVEEILGIPSLSIEDQWGISVASVRMERPLAVKAKALIELAMESEARGTT